MVRVGGILGALLLLGAAVAAAPTQLIPPGAVWRWQALGAGPAPDGWTRSEYDDAAWSRDVGGFSAGYSGYQQAATRLPTLLSDGPLRGVLLRTGFRVDAPQEIVSLFLRLEYEDGVRVWLNGQDVFRGGYGPGPEAAPVTHPSGAAELLDLSAHRGLLVSGTNWLAMEIRDASAAGVSLFGWGELRANFSRGPQVQGVSSNTVTLVWQGPPGAEGWVEWAPMGEETWRTAGSETAAGESSVTLRDLEPGREYRYRVGGRVGEDILASDPAVFRTLKAGGDFALLVVGDAGAGLAPGYTVGAMLAREDPDLVLHVGDIVYPGFTRARVDLRCFSVYETLLRGVPLFPTPGNHEVYGSEADYLDLFRLPANPVTGTEHFYSFDHGSAHIVSMYVPYWHRSGLGVRAADGGPGPQLAWLETDLAATTQPWKFVFFHQPMRSSGPHTWDDYDYDGLEDSVQLRETLLPILARHGVQLVFHGHDHFWERLAPTNGVHTVVTGGGGAFLYPAVRPDPASARVIVDFHAARVRSQGDTLRVEAVDVEGRVLDAMVIGLASSGGEAMAASWHTPAAGADGASNGDGNRVGETFEFSGEPRITRSGRSANLGGFVVNEDAESIHLGFRDVMVRREQTIVMWVASPRRAGVGGTGRAGDVLGHPLADLALAFEGFEPAVVALLGDEWADETDALFVRPGTTMPLGQGVFHWDKALTPVPRAGVRQFNRSPEAAGDPVEQNADFIHVTLPRSALGGVLPGDVLHVGAVVVTPVARADGISLALDSACLGELDEAGGAPTDGGQGLTVLRPVRVVLGPPPDGDLDLDGLGTEAETAWGTDPRHPDSDGDGLPDGWEVAHGLNPVSAEGGDGARGDPDGDGYDNATEYRSGTDPRDGTPTLRVRAEASGAGVWLTWRAMLGWRYDVETAENLPGAFASLGIPGFPRAATAVEERVWVPREGLSGIPPGAGEPGGARWFRIRAIPPLGP